MLAACSTQPTRSDAGLDASSCVTASIEASPAPSVLLFLIQRSGSMAAMNKWTYAAQAITATIDLRVFDGMGVGLMAAPSTNVAGPACIAGGSVACGIPSYPQVALRIAGTNRSTDDVGVRRALADWLVTNAPDQFAGDGNPLYAAIQAGLAVLQSFDVGGKRMLFVVTDGQLSCTSLSMRPAFVDANGCSDWEDPQNVVELVRKPIGCALH